MSKFEPKPGDIVRHTGNFLRSIQWCLDVPVNGMVLKVKSNDKIAVVLWCDQDEGMSINVSNIEMCPTNKGVTDEYRETLMKTFGADGVVAFTKEEM